MAHLWSYNQPVGTGTSARRARETGDYFYAFEFLLDPANRRGAVQKADGTWIIIEAIDIPFPAINFPRGLGRRSESAFGTIIDWTGTICTNNLHRYRWASTSATLPSWAGRGTRVIVSAAEHREIKLRRRQFYGFQPISRLSDDANAIIRQFFDHALDHEEIPGTASWQVVRAWSSLCGDTMRFDRTMNWNLWSPQAGTWTTTMPTMTWCTCTSSFH